MKEFTQEENNIIWELVGDEIKRISDNFSNHLLLKKPIKNYLNYEK